MTHFSMFGITCVSLCFSKWTVLDKALLFLNAAFRFGFFCPQLSAEQQSEMCELRQQAVQLEVKKKKKQRKNYWALGQNLQGQAQVSNTTPFAVWRH